MSNYLSTRLKTPVTLTDGTIRRLQGGSPHLRQSWRSRTSRTCRSALERLRWKQFAGAQNVEYLLRELGARSLNAAPPTVIYIRKLIIRFRPHLPLLSPRYPENWFPELGALSYIFFLLKPCLVAGAKFLIGESRHLRINGDLIKDYSSTKIKINRVPLAEGRKTWVAEERGGGGWEHFAWRSRLANSLNYTKSDRGQRRWHRLVEAHHVRRNEVEDKSTLRTSAHCVVRLITRVLKSAARKNESVSPRGSKTAVLGH